MNWDPTVALIVAAIGLTAIGLVYLLSQPRKQNSGKRTREAPRREPSLDGESDSEIDRAIDELDQTLSGRGPETARSGDSDVGSRPQPDFEKIVSLFVQAPDGQAIRGPDLVVAAEKAGLVFGAMNIFHRLVDGRPEQGPIFSVANMVKPGSFDLAKLEQLETPGLSFFMTLPGPLPGLDAWEAMQPAAQRMAELLGAQVLDDKRNTLGRQRIAHLRDELRAYDRRHEAQGLKGW
ncbi:cell division protein ZipA [Pseudomarimonas arenosa]|uniref:Cell division protein ZipA n=1 Tax=Pseudomarimonas arenosa TaxID=2774145 RepID=A0AAW3ZH38_9GAMM|nr:cell division protein ZipA [Pseudomarimonas arenosa]MBD8525343.1 cell division protein ZipA [Pseudomarimonas arenosa]